MLDLLRTPLRSSVSWAGAVPLALLLLPNPQRHARETGPLRRTAR